MSSRGREFERVDRDAVTELERNPCRQQHGRNAAVDSRDSRDGLAHLPSRIDREDDLVVAFGPILLGEQLHMPRRLLPVDRPAIHAGAEIDERVEVRPFAARELRDQTLERVSLKHARALVMHRPKVGKDGQGGADLDRGLLPGKAKRAGPAQP